MFDDFVIVVPGGELVHFFFTPQDATSGILQWCKRIVLLPKISGFNRSTIYNWWILVDFPGMSVDRMVDRFWIPGHGSRIYRNTLKWCPALQEGPPQRCWLVSVGLCQCHQKFLSTINWNPKESNRYCTSKPTENYRLGTHAGPFL